MNRATILLVLIPLLACSESAEQAALPRAVELPVLAAHAEPQPAYAVDESYAGRVVSRRSSELGFERAGRLAQIGVDRGDRVEAGERLAALESDALEARERELVARVAQYEARLALAKATTTRKRTLHAGSHASGQELDEAAYAEEALGAELAAARAALEAVRVDLADSVLVAPYAGSITARMRDEGTVVSAGTPILELIEDRALEVEIGLPAERAAELAVGSPHVLEIEGRRVPARVEAVLSKVRADTRTVPVVFRLEDSVGARSGALARLRLERRVEGEGFWVPVTALAESHRGLWSLYALRAEPGNDQRFRIERRQVEVLHSEADRAYVRGTVEAGERLVATGLHRLVPGQLVRLSGRDPALAGDPHTLPVAVQ